MGFGTSVMTDKPSRTGTIIVVRYIKNRKESYVRDAINPKENYAEN